MTERRMTKRCSACGRDLPVDQFRQRKHRSGNVGPSADCNACHKAYNESLRRRDAAAAGRTYRTREGIASDQRQREVEHQAQQEVARTAAHARKLEEARDLLAREAEQRAQAEEEAKRPMPHARAIDAEMLQHVDVEAFWSGVNKNGPVMSHMTTPCWEWSGDRKKGYGRVEVVIDGKRLRVAAHRLAWAMVNGPIPDGICVLHECDNPPCVRHLFLGKPADNTADMMAKGRGAYPPGTTPPHLMPFTRAFPPPGSRAAANAAKTSCPKCGGPLIASSHASQHGRRRCPPCTRAQKAERQAEWNRRARARRLVVAE